MPHEKKRTRQLYQPLRRTDGGRLHSPLRGVLSKLLHQCLAFTVASPRTSILVNLLHGSCPHRPRLKARDDVLKGVRVRAIAWLRATIPIVVGELRRLF